MGSSSLEWPVDSNDGDLGVGGTDDGNLFRGWIDDLRFYNIPLHAKEVMESYGRGAGDFGPTLILLWIGLLPQCLFP